MSVLVGLGCRINRLIDISGEWLAMLFLRFLLFWEFWTAGMNKLTGKNWFTDIQDDFPFPFSIINPDISWFIAMWAELICSVAILFGIFTRFVSLQLIVVTIVAIISVHLGSHAYAISDAGGVGDFFRTLMANFNVTKGGYELPLLFLGGLIVLAFKGPGKLSVDALANRMICKGE